MSGWLYGLLIYISIVFLWGVINLVTFAASYLRKKNYLKGLDLLNNIFLTIIQIGLLIWAGGVLWLFYSSKEWLMLFLALMFGGIVLNFYAMFYLLLAAPFLFITTSLSERVENTKNQTWEEYEGEVISPDGEVASSFMSDDKVNKRLAIWFLLNYFLYLVGYLTDSQSRQGWNWSTYITSPIFGILISSVPIMLGYAVLNLIKHKKAFTGSLNLFVANTLRILGVIIVGLYILRLLLW